MQPSPLSQGVSPLAGRHTDPSVFSTSATTTLNRWAVPVSTEETSGTWQPFTRTPSSRFARTASGAAMGGARRASAALSESSDVLPSSHVSQMSLTAQLAAKRPSHSSVTAHQLGGLEDSVPAVVTSVNFDDPCDEAPHRSVDSVSSRNAGAPDGDERARSRDSLRRSTSLIVETNVARTTLSRQGRRRINQYRLGGRLGTGAFSEVYLALDSSTKLGYAMKILDRHRLAKLHHMHGEVRSEAEEKILREIAVLKRLRHPNIIALHEVINDPASNELFIVLELADSGCIMTLDDYGNVMPDDHGNTRLPEDEAARIAKALLGAIRFAHFNGVAHRDIKPQNVLLNEAMEVKLADFGVSNIMAEWPSVEYVPADDEDDPFSGDGDPLDGLGNGLSRDFDSLPMDDADRTLSCAGPLPEPAEQKLKYRPAGTICFMPPEFLDPHRREGDIMALAELYQADVWSFGVTMYTLTIGCLPWKAIRATALFEAIQASGDDLPFPPDCEASPALRDFLQLCIRTNPADRAPLRSLAHHAWVRGASAVNNQSMYTPSTLAAAEPLSFGGGSFAPRSLPPPSVGAEEEFRNFSFDNRARAAAASSLCNSVSFCGEPPVSVTPGDLTTAVTARRPASTSQSLDASRRNFEDFFGGPSSPFQSPINRVNFGGPQRNASIAATIATQPLRSPPAAGGPSPPAALDYSTLHTASPPAHAWFSPTAPPAARAEHSPAHLVVEPMTLLDLNQRATGASGSREPSVGLDLLTCGDDGDDLASPKSPPLIVTDSCPITPNAGGVMLPSCLRPREDDLGADDEAAMVTAADEADAEDNAEQLDAVRRAFAGVMSPPAEDPFSLSKTQLFTTSRDRLPGCATPLIPTAPSH